MGYEVGEEISVYIILDAAGLTMTYTVYDEADVLFATNPMTDVGNGRYKASFTPDAVGEWVVIAESSTGSVKTGFVYPVGLGGEARIQASGDVVIYIVSPDADLDVIADDGMSPEFTDEVSKANANEAAGEADPAWIETFTIDEEGAVNLQSLFSNLVCALKRTAGTTAYGKFQVSDDAGVSWYDLTDDFSTVDTSYENIHRQGTYRPITTIGIASGSYQIRLCTWTDGTTVESKMRSDSYQRLSMRKS